jgi:hypothetical protein
MCNGHCLVDIYVSPTMSMMLSLKTCMYMFMDDFYMLMKMRLEWMKFLYVYGCETWVGEIFICVWMCVNFVYLKTGVNRK